MLYAVLWEAFCSGYQHQLTLQGIDSLSGGQYHEQLWEVLCESELEELLEQQPILHDLRASAEDRFERLDMDKAVLLCEWLGLHPLRLKDSLAIGSCLVLEGGGIRIEVEDE